MLMKMEKAESKPFSAHDFVATGYTVEPACNGGFVVIRGANFSPSPYKSEVAAFSNSSDLLKYLQQGHSEDGGAE